MTDYELAETIIEYSDDEKDTQEIIFECSDEEEIQELTEYYYISQGIMFKYFVGYEITTLLGYKNPKQTIRNSVSKSNQIPFREYPGVKIPSLNPRTILITHGGAVEILLKTRKILSPDILHIFKKFGIETTNRKCLTKEQQTLSAITNVFKTEKFEDQYKVGNYYLDLYYPQYKLICECDEFDHADRRPSDERERMDFVNKELGIDDTHWIRYNPDADDFDISLVIGKILTKMRMKGEWKKPYVPPTKAKRNINLSSEKPCTKCNVVQPLKNFHKASDHLDGRENVCKPCRVIRQEAVIAEKRRLYVEENCKNGEITELTCNMCKETLDIGKFYKDKNSPTGRMRKCNDCLKEHRQKMEKKEKVYVTEKKCTACKETKLVEEFNKRISSKDGYNIYCKICSCAKVKSFYYKKKSG